MPPKLLPHPGYGDLLTVERFLRAVRDGNFVDYDGMGSWATATEVEDGLDSWVWPSQITSGQKTPPEWATHVLWFNR